MEDSTFEKNVAVQFVDCIERAKCFADLHYEVRLNLPRGEWYTGSIVVSFKVKEVPSRDLWLDFRGVKIDNYSVNGEAVAGASIFANHHVILPSSHLRPGETNTVKLDFLNKYRRDGIGLHSFTDKTDGLQYLHSKFEAAFCHYVFPCFD